MKATHILSPTAYPNSCYRQIKDRFWEEIDRLLLQSLDKGNAGIKIYLDPTSQDYIVEPIEWKEVL